MADGVEFADLNWLGLGLAVLANLVLGMVWYNPKTPTGRVWMQGAGMTADRRATGRELARGLILMVIGASLTMFVLAHTYVAYRDAVDLDRAGDGYDLTVADGLTGAFFVWLGFFVPVLWSGVAWENKPWSLFAVNAGYYLVALLAAGLLLVLVPG